MDETLYGLSLIIVDDEEIILQHTVLKIQTVAPLCRIVATAKDGVEALELVRLHRPNIVITDIKMPHMDGLELAKSIRNMFPNIYVVIVSGFSDFQYARQAIKYAVFDYLLKPVETEKLRDVLSEINRELETANNRNIRSFTVLRPGKQNDRKQQVLKGDMFGLFFFNFYNLCFDESDATLTEQYRKELTSLNWDKILGINDGFIKDSVIGDEYMPNQKSVTIAFSSEDRVKLPDLAGTLRERFQTEYSALPVNIICHNEPIKRSDIWLYSKRLRNAMNTAIIACNPQIIIMEEQEFINGNDEVTDALKQQVENKIKAFLTSKDKQELKKELCKVFLCLATLPQKKVEKVISYILSRLEYHLGNYDLERSEMTQMELFRALSLSQTVQDIEQKFIECIDTMLYQGAQDCRRSDVPNRLLDYVDRNYVAIDSIEELAEVFCYNTTYLSRLFKKISGTTLSKYIMIKRIEAAKKLLKSSDVSVGTVSEMVGYQDQQYFSRVFRSFMGMSPSEYKRRQD